VYFEPEDLDMTIRDVFRKRLTSDGPYPWSSAESFEDLDNAKRDIVRKGLISADSLELKLFLTRISQEIRRLYNSAVLEVNAGMGRCGRKQRSRWFRKIRCG